jgi:O-antigen/teichoic acid export membrane protein
MCADSYALIVSRPRVQAPLGVRAMPACGRFPMRRGRSSPGNCNIRNRTDNLRSNMAAENSKTVPQLITVTTARAIMLAAWFFATRLLAVTLGPAGFGLYFLCQSAIRVLTGCIGDPLDMAVMREAPLLLRGDRTGALELIRSAFWLRVVIALALLLLAILIPSFASRAIFASGDLRALAVLTIAGVLGDFLLRSALGYFQVSQQFNRFLAVDAVWQLGRVAVVVILVLLHRLTAPAGIALYVIAPYATFMVAFPLLPRDVRQVARPHNRHVTGILKYSSWIVIGLAMAALGERLDVFILERYRGKLEVGVYGGAVFLASIPDFLDGMLQTVLAPKVAPAYADGTFNQLQFRYMKYAIPGGILAGTIAIALSSWGIHHFFNASYAGAIPAFRILILGTLFNLVFTSMPAALVNFIAPKRMVIFTAIGLATVAIGSLLSIPRYGAIGAAVTMLAARAIVGGLVVGESFGLTRRRLRATLQ